MPLSSRDARAPRRSLIVASVVVAVLAVTTSAATAQTAPPDPPSDIVELDISFEVQNVNRSAIPCEGVDGQTYTLQGVLTAPADALAGGPDDTATLILHGLGYGAFFSNFEETPGYDFAEMQAEAGNVTVAVDRLGYGESPMPDGFAICFGSHADMAHQMVLALRNGTYTLEGRSSEAFENVVLAGHSVGGIIVQAEAYSFGDIDGLIVLSYSDLVTSDLAMRYAMEAATLCQEQGGQPSENGSPGYVGYGQTPLEFAVGHFATGHAAPEVVFETTAMRNINPCGDILSFMAAVQTNLDNVDEIDVPTLILAGGLDNFFPPPAVSRQAELYTGTGSVTEVVIPATGHALTLHFNRTLFSAAVDRWLEANIGADAGTGAPTAVGIGAACNAVADQASGFTDVTGNVHADAISCLTAGELTQGITPTTYGPGVTVTRGQIASFLARLVDTANALEADGVDLGDLGPYDGTNTFSDLTDGYAHTPAINRLADAGIVTGTSATTYDADAPVTRGQVAALIARTQDYLGEAFTSSREYFSDDDGSVFEDQINAVAEAGIAVGTGDSFRPSDSLPRDQLASILARHLAVNALRGLIQPLPATS